MAADDQLDRPLAADELAAIADDPLRAYVEPDRSLRGTSNSLAEGGIIIYPISAASTGRVPFTRIYAIRTTMHGLDRTSIRFGQLPSSSVT